MIVSTCYSFYTARMRAKTAFSLIELSIVLVILGLLVGGILAGRSLIRASEVRSVITEANRFNTATIAFRDKYFGLPGDITNATSIWGKDTTTSAACAGAAGNAATPGTCNGDGDGYVVQYAEAFRLWQQLNLAGLLEGNYPGYISPQANTTPTVPGRDMPASRLGNAGWTIEKLSQLSTTNYELGYSDLPDKKFNFMVLGGPNTAYWSNAPVLRPEEAWNIDTKMDDGSPANGRLRAGPNSLFCTTAYTSDALYKMSSSTIGCIVGFIFG